MHLSFLLRLKTKKSGSNKFTEEQQKSVKNRQLAAKNKQHNG